MTPTYLPQKAKSAPVEVQAEVVEVKDEPSLRLIGTRDIPGITFCEVEVTAGQVGGIYGVAFNFFVDGWIVNMNSTKVELGPGEWTIVESWADGDVPMTCEPDFYEV